MAAQRRNVAAMNIVRGTLAEGTETPPRPYRLRDSGRRDADPTEWTRPLPPTLWQRLDDEQRELSVKAREQAAADEARMRQAVSEGSRPPKPKAVAAGR